VKKLIKEDQGIVNYNCESKMTGLMMAVSYNQTVIVKEILSTPNIDISLRGVNSYTALHYSCNRKSVDSLKLLLKHPSCSPEIVEMKTIVGKTAEMMATNLGYTECVDEIKSFLDKRRCTTSSLLSAASTSSMQTVINLPFSTSLNQDSNIFSSSILSEDARPGTVMSLEQIQADLKDLIDIEKLRDEKVEILREKEKKENEVLTNKLKDIINDQNSTIEQLKQEKQSVVKLYDDDIKKEEDKLKILISKHEEEVRAMKEKHQRAMDDDKIKFSRGQKRKRELQAELKNRIAPLLSSSKTTVDSSSIIPECYVCFEECRPPLNLMTCGSGHLICEPCFLLMERKICGKCRSFITGRATDTEEMIRKALRREGT